MLKWRLSKNAATIGGQKIAALSSTHIAKYRDGRLKVVGRATINKELNLMAHALETARRERGIHIPENPVRLVRRPQGAKVKSLAWIGNTLT